MYQTGENASKSKTRMYNIWKMMRKRCRCESRSDYKYYGGKGIKVCPEWDNPEYGYEVFRFWALRNGYRDDLTIDRIDNNGDYCPENCRWVTMAAQAYNKSTTVHPENAPSDPQKKEPKRYWFKGKGKTLYGWGKELGIDYRVLHNRIKRGWSIEKTLTTPINPNFSHK